MGYLGGIGTDLKNAPIHGLGAVVIILGVLLLALYLLFLLL